MRHLLLSLSLLGGASWAQQDNAVLQEPPQAAVFHVEPSDFQAMRKVQTRLESAGLAAHVLLCEQGGYIVCLPVQSLPSDAYESWSREIERGIAGEGLQVYAKPGAAVTELAQNCDQLLKAFLELQTR